MKRKLINLLLVFCFSLAACAQLPGVAAQPTILFSPPGPTITAVPDQPQPSPSESPTAVPAQIRAYEQAAIEAMSAKYNIPVDQIQVIKSEASTWPTGCLGVVIPGVLCTKGPVDGYRITLAADGKQFEFHTNQDGSSVIDAAQLLSTLQFAVSGSDQTVNLISSNIPLGPTYNPAFNGFLPAGGSAGGTAYVLDFTNGSRVLALDGSGSREMSFVKNPNYGLAVWPGAAGVPARLAWGTQLMDASNPSILQISNVDGSQLETLVTADAGSDRPVQLVAEFWSVDGQSLYYSQEPVGIGGYITFAGGSNLYRVNITTKEVTALIPQTSAMLCLDALSGDYRFVADHCAKNSITIRDLNNGSAATSIQPPADLSGFNFVGSARFSPDGSRLAFALAKGDPSAEQGWLAVSDLTVGTSKLIYTGEAGVYYTIDGWLDNQTLLLESHGLTCNPTCGNQLWTIGMDGSNLMKVADGSLLAVVDKR